MKFWFIWDILELCEPYIHGENSGTEVLENIGGKFHSMKSYWVYKYMTLIWSKTSRRNKSQILSQIGQLISKFRNLPTVLSTFWVVKCPFHNRSLLNFAWHYKLSQYRKIEWNKNMCINTDRDLLFVLFWGQIKNPIIACYLCNSVIHKVFACITTNIQ